MKDSYRFILLEQGLWHPLEKHFITDTEFKLTR